MSDAKILFFSHEVKDKVKSRNKIKKWLLNTAASHYCKIESINIILCSDQYLLELNKQFLDHDDFTDIITFNYEEKGNPIIGELYISIDRVRENARMYKMKIEREKRRVIIHGLLHLIGFTDEDKEKRAKMTSLENQYLQVFDSIFTE